MPHSGLTGTILLGEAENRRIINLLLQVVSAAFHLADNTEDSGQALTVERADFDALSVALDALDTLPDDQPGYVMNGPARAQWALRALLQS